MRRWMLAAGLALLGAFAVRRSLVQVQGPSMEPTLWAGDRLITVPARSAWLRPGQVVVLSNPADPSHLIIKRILRLSGDRVELRGDDLTRSTDGRTWGLVPGSSITRIAVTRWPAILSPVTVRSPASS